MVWVSVFLIVRDDRIDACQVQDRAERPLRLLLCTNKARWRELCRWVYPGASKGSLASNTAGFQHVLWRTTNIPLLQHADLSQTDALVLKRIWVVDARGAATGAA